MAKRIITKAQAIERLLDEVYNWDIKDLHTYVAESLELQYDKTSALEIEDEFNSVNGIFNEDEEGWTTIAENTKAGKILFGD